MILITGADGYLGYNIYNEFKKKKYKIIGTTKKINKIHKLNIDFENFNINEKKFGKLKIDTIIHLVSLNQIKAEENFNKAKKISIDGTKKLIEFAIKNNIKKFIYFSTAQVYGKNLTGVVTENTTLSPINNYAKIHKMTEDLCNKYSKHFKYGVIILRLSNIIGSPGRPDKKLWKLVCNDFCNQAIRKNKIMLKSSGSQTRDFLSIKSLNQIIENVVNKKDLKNKFNIFNVGSGNSITVLKLAETVQERAEKLFNKKPEIIIKGKSKNIQINYVYNIDKMFKYKFNYIKNDIIKEIDNTLIYCNSIK